MGFGGGDVDGDSYGDNLTTLVTGFIAVASTNGWVPLQRILRNRPTHPSELTSLTADADLSLRDPGTGG